MKKIIAAVLVLICIFGLVGCSPMDNVPTLEAVKEYSAEDFNEHFKGVNREGLIEVWGEPAGSLTEENADMWDIDDESMVVIYWKNNGKFKDAGISIKEGDSGECLELPDIAISNGSYQLFFKCPPSENDTQWAMPVLTLSAKDETFVFGHYTDAVNGFASGTFEVDGDTLTCKADDGNQYIFTISDTDTLCYVKDGSAALEVFEVSYLSHKEGETILVEDGATFLRHGDIIIE